MTTDKALSTDTPNSATETPSLFSPDRPIRNAADDEFSRNRFANVIAQQIVSLPKEESFVLGLSGPWGSGKTSILNLLEKELEKHEDVIVIWFNPWLFSGTSELLEQFFSELVAQIAEQRPEDPLSAKITEGFGNWFKRLHQMAGAVGSVVALHQGATPAEVSAANAASSAAAQAAGEGLLATSQRLRNPPVLQGSVRAQRAKIEQLLKDFKQRVVIFIDDLDRLHQDEVREVVRLVRLTADFPNLYYVLAFDRFRVEEALSEKAEHGRAYLEKIFQIIYDIPALRSTDLQIFLAAEVSKVISNKELSPSHQEYLSSLFFPTIAQLFNQPRDVRRYINSLLFSIAAVGDEIALPDLLALEAIRTLLPHTFSKLQTASHIVTLSNTRREVTKEDKKIIEDIIDSAADEPIFSKLLGRIFPITTTGEGNFEQVKTWRRQRRVAYLDNFLLYLSKVQPSQELLASQIDDIFSSLGDKEKLESKLSVLDPDKLAHFISRLFDYEADYKVDVARIGLPVLINQARKLTDTDRDWLGPTHNLRVVIVLFLRKVNDLSERYSILKQLFEEANTLSWKSNLLGIAEGWHEDEARTRKLINEKDTEELKTQYIELVRTAVATKPRELNTEKHLAVLLEDFYNIDPSTNQKVIQDFAHYDDSFIAILTSCMNQTIIIAPTLDMLNTQDTRRIFTLPWKALIKLLGLTLLSQRVRDLKDYKATTADGQIALATALDYLEGRRVEELARSSKQANTPTQATHNPNAEETRQVQATELGEPSQSSREVAGSDAQTKAEPE